MDFRRVIAARRAGEIHAADDLRELCEGAARGTIPDYQLAAWLMAAVLRPLTPGETADLTLAMAASGERLDLSGLPRPWVDKHSTGGVGDKTTLVLLPLLAACGLTMAKMSGRGLGITGGTIDKLESVPGFRTDLDPAEMVAQAGRIGIALTGQTPDLAPADKALYALRDATGTVDSLPLIVSSILSKKIAGGAETVVLDVKCGSGAFMRTLPEARALAAALRETGERAGLNVRVAITDMDTPLGAAVGNALEVAEARAVLRGDDLTPPVARFRELCVALADLALDAVGRAPEAEAVLADGRAWAKAREWFSAQGADWEAWSPSPAPRTREIVAERDGVVARVDARAVGLAAVALGAGRQVKTDVIDPRVGLVLLAGVGDRVARGQPVATVHLADRDADLDGAFEMTDTPVAARAALIELA